MGIIDIEYLEILTYLIQNSVHPRCWKASQGFLLDPEFKRVTKKKKHGKHENIVLLITNSPSLLHLHEKYIHVLMTNDSPHIRVSNCSKSILHDAIIVNLILYMYERRKCN